YRVAVQEGRGGQPPEQHHRDDRSGTDRQRRDPLAAEPHGAASSTPPEPNSSSEAWSCSAWNSGVRSMSGVRGRGRSTSMTSLTRPGRGLITATRSERKIASEIPWVTI